MSQTLAILSVILILAAGPPYVLDILRKKTKPQRATWLIFTVLGLIAFISQLQLGATWSLVFLGLDTLGSLAVLILSIPYGVGGFSILDKYALSVATVGVLIAILAREPIIALLGVMAADLAGALPTIHKAYIAPDSETTISWLLVGTAALLGAFTVGKMDFNLLIYPIYLTIIQYAIPIAQFVGLRVTSKRYSS
ncbi:MAG: hypothetical protein JWO96_393 [Candidatus Saccharibacteria bacterium]|nr:hypothetical protein [Candidatus Saccharibacteria bacterium]